MDRSYKPLFAFGLGAGAGTAGGLIGLGGAEFRLPALLGPLGFRAHEAIPINLLASLVVLAVALPVRHGAVPVQEIAPHLVPLVAMMAGAVSAAWFGAGWVKRLSERVLANAVIVLLVGLGLLLVAEGLFREEPLRLVSDGWFAEASVALAAGVFIGLVSSLLGVAGGELIIPIFVLLFGIDTKVAGSMSAIVGLPTIAAGLIRWLSGPSILGDRRALLGAVAPLAAGSALGAVIGGALLGIVPEGALKIALGFILVWSALRLLGHRTSRPTSAAGQ